MVNQSRIGSDFDEFLREEGLLEETSAVALKRVIAWELGEAMKSQGVTKSEMATRMGTSRSQLDRVLAEDGEGGGMTLDTLGRALDALGLRIRLEVHGDKRIASKGVRKVVRRSRSPKGKQAATFRDRQNKRAASPRSNV